MSLKNNKPIIFSSDIHWTSNKSGIASAASTKDSILVSTPPEFGGTEGDWSPEHLFLSAVTSCYLSTYLALADKMKIEHTGFECTATGQVELIDGKYKFTYIHLYPRAFVGNNSHVEKAQVAMEKAKKYCLISNSISAEIIQHPEVTIDKRQIKINTAA